MRIVAERLTYVYNPKTPFAKKAIDEIDLEIEEGEFFGIIGHTGSGKSTFIQHLNGLMKPTSGSLKIGEMNLTDKKCDYLGLRAKVGMVFQYPEYQLFAETCEADVAFGIKNFFPELKAEEVKEKVKSAIEIVGLSYEEVKNKSPFELSGGQKRRIAIAGVIVAKPEILILDEPAAGLDPVGKKELLALLHSLHKNFCKTIIIISHDMDEIAENCSRIAVFNNGKIECVLPPSELFSNAEMLLKLGLDIPVTVKVMNRLKKCGIGMAGENFRLKDFLVNIEEILEKNKISEDGQNA